MRGFMTEPREPTSRQGPAGQPSLATRIARAPYAKGLPELALFPDAASRERALEEIERAMTPRTFGQLGKFLVAVVLFLLIPAGLGYFVAALLMPSMPPWNARIGIGITLVGYTIAVAMGIRNDMPRSLRKSLLDLGVPVCLPCGYDLRALPSQTTHCPECGKPLHAKAIAALQDPAAKASGASATHP